MYVGYDETGEQGCPYSDLDEYLCEYVDGEMDPSVRAVFEEIINRDPALGEHVEHLRQTRAMLCDYSTRVGAPCSLHARLHRELSHELAVGEHMINLPFSARLNRVATFASAFVLALTIGFYITDFGAAELTASESGRTRIATVQAPPAVRAFRGVPVLLGSPLFRQPLRTGIGTDYAAALSAGLQQAAFPSDSQGTFLPTVALTANAFAP